MHGIARIFGNGLLQWTILLLIVIACLDESSAVTIITSGPSDNEKVPAMIKAPTGLPDVVRDNLEHDRLALVTRRDDLRQRIAWHDKNCHIYDANSELAKICPGMTKELGDAKQTYITDAKHYNYSVSEAIGSENLRLQKIIDEMNLALQRDATAVNNLGFHHRAEDFQEWDKLSEEGHRKLWESLSGKLIDYGQEKFVEKAIYQLGHVPPDEVVAMLVKYGYGSTPAQDMLLNHQAANVIAKQLFHDIKGTLEMKEKFDSGNTLEGTAKLIEFIAPESLEGFFNGVKAGEVAVWAVYDASAQFVAVSQVKALNELTAAQLIALKSLKCVTERHLLKKYDAEVALAKLNGRDSSDLVKPHQSGNCAAG